MQSRREDFDRRQEQLRAGRDPKRRGELAELAFIHKATSLGFVVVRPPGDSEPFDFVVLSGPRVWKVQVKSAGTIKKRIYKLRGQKSANGHGIPYTAEEIDFLVVYIVSEDDWFVIPVRALAPRGNVRVYPRGVLNESRFEKYREAWSLMG